MVNTFRLLYTIKRSTILKSISRSHKISIKNSRTIDDRRHKAPPIIYRLRIGKRQLVPAINLYTKDPISRYSYQNCRHKEICLFSCLSFWLMDCAGGTWLMRRNWIQNYGNHPQY